MGTGYTGTPRAASRSTVAVGSPGALRRPSVSRTTPTTGGVGVAQPLGQRGLPVGRQGRGIVDRPRASERLGQARERRRDGLAREGDDLDRGLGRDPRHGRAGVPQQSPRDLAPRDRHRPARRRPTRTSAPAGGARRASGPGRPSPCSPRRPPRRSPAPGPPRAPAAPGSARRAPPPAPGPPGAGARAAPGPPAARPAAAPRARARSPGATRSPRPRPRASPTPAGQHEPGPAGRAERHRTSSGGAVVEKPAMLHLRRFLSSINYDKFNISQFKPCSRRSRSRWGLDLRALLEPCARSIGMAHGGLRGIGSLRLGRHSSPRRGGGP